MIFDLDKRPPENVAAKDSAKGELLYGEIVSFTSVIGAIIPARSVVFLLTENNVGGIAWSIGMINARVVPLLLSAHIDKDLYNHLYELYVPQFICIPETKLEKGSFPVLKRAFGYVLLKTGEKSYPVYKHLSHLLPTSGSTGSPKLVRHSYENITSAALNISTFFELTSKERPLMVLPLYYTMGLSMVFSHLYVGATILITNLSMTDRSFWNFMKEEHATSFTGVPYSFEILNLMRFFYMDFPDLTLLTQGGGKMSRELNLKFAEYCSELGKRWIATYGQSEGTARMSWLPPEYAISKVGSIGRAVPNGELFLIDEKGEIIEKPYTEGEMCYRGRNVTLGYALKYEDLMKADERYGVLHTGDLAYRDGDGCYYIVGRMGRFLKFFGMRIGLDECEQIIKSKYAIDCACVGTDDRMIIYITDPLKRQMVKEELVNKTRIVASAFEVRIIDEIPRNDAGKILYHNLRNK